MEPAPPPARPASSFHHQPWLCAQDVPSDIRDLTPLSLLRPSPALREALSFSGHFPLLCLCLSDQILSAFSGTAVESQDLRAKGFIFYSENAVLGLEQRKEETSTLSLAARSVNQPPA